MAQKKITDLTLRSSFDDTCNFPVDDTAQTWRTTGAQLRSFILTQPLIDYVKAQIPPTKQSYDITNLTLVTSVGASALTIAVKTQTGVDASTSDPITVGMRSPTLASGTYNKRTISGALSMVVSSGSTLGQIDTKPANIYVYLIDNGGTLELAVSHSYYPEDALVTTTAEGGVGGADSATAIYSTVARSNVPIRLIGVILNTQSVAGTWASAGSQVQLAPYQTFKAPTSQTFTSGSGTYYTPAGAKYLRVRMAGGGGGGGAIAGGNNGSDGTDTTFGSNLLIASKGTGGKSGAPFQAAGGGFTVNSPAINSGSSIGGSGGGGLLSAWSEGNAGGNNPRGGGAPTQTGGVAGFNGTANTGGGGGGAGGTGTGAAGGGGAGAGGWVEALIPNPSGSYAYTVGAGGAGGTGTVAGGTGGSGVIIIEEYYQ